MAGTKMQGREILVTLVLVAFVHCGVDATEDARGVDDWGAQNVSKFLKDSGVNVKADVLEAAGIDDGHALLSSDDEDLSKLGLKPADLIKVKKGIDAKRESIAKAPTDVFEWRAAHLRLTDYWILPLLNLCPRACLIWARFFDTNHAIEKFNDEIDGIADWEFCLKFAFVPSLPIYQVAQKLNSHTYVDESLVYCCLIKSVVEVLDVIMHVVQRDFAWWFIKKLIEVALAGIGASFCYHVLYWMIPTAICDICMDVYIYFTIPLFCVLMTLGILIKIRKMLAPKPAQGKSKVE